MGFVNTFSASGQGTLDLGGEQSVNEVAVRIITPADFATLTGIPGITRVHQQGWIGLGLTPSSGVFSGITLLFWQVYLENESFSYLRDFAVNVPADTLYFDIKDGGVMYLEVDWP